MDYFSPKAVLKIKHNKSIKDVRPLSRTTSACAVSTSPVEASQGYALSPLPCTLTSGVPLLEEKGLLLLHYSQNFLISTASSLRYALNIPGETSPQIVFHPALHQISYFPASAAHHSHPSRLTSCMISHPHHDQESRSSWMEPFPHLHCTNWWDWQATITSIHRGDTPPPDHRRMWPCKGSLSPSIGVEPKTRGTRKKFLLLQDPSQTNALEKMWGGDRVPATVRASHSRSPSALSVSAYFKFETHFDSSQKLFMLNRN